MAVNLILSLSLLTKPFLDPGSLLRPFWLSHVNNLILQVARRSGAHKQPQGFMVPREVAAFLFEPWQARARQLSRRRLKLRKGNFLRVLVLTSQSNSKLHIVAPPCSLTFLNAALIHYFKLATKNTKHLTPTNDSKKITGCRVSVRIMES